jgi:DNA invertase Pin-like site-specific DNA recombinase
MTTKLAGVYVRISRDKAGQALGVERQRKACAELAQSLGYAVKVYEDNDKSAYSGKARPGYLRMMDDVAAGRLSAVLAWHPDRLHRSPRELEDFIDAITAKRVDVHTVQTGHAYDLNTPAGRMSARQIGVWARYESEHKAERLKAKHKENAEAGNYRGGSSRPFGYKKDGLTVVSAEADELRRLTTAVLGGESISALVRDLNNRKVRTATGANWSNVALRQVLKRARNAGKSVHNGEVVGEGQWPAIVDESEWRSVCAVLRDPARRQQRSNRVKHLLAGIAVCGVCGGKVHSAASVNRDGTRRTTYKCHVYPDALPIEEKVTRWVRLLLCSPDAIRAMLKPRKVNKAIHREVEQLRTRLDNAALAHARGELSLRQYSATSKILEADLQSLEAQDVNEEISSVLGEGLNIGERWRDLSLARKRAVIDFLVTVTLLPRGKVQIVPRHPDVESGLVALNRAERDELAQLLT